MDATLNAIARLASFRASWNKGDLICEDSGLTADDLDLILRELQIEPIEWAKMRDRATGPH